MLWINLWEPNKGIIFELLQRSNQFKSYIMTYSTSSFILVLKSILYKSKGDLTKSFLFNISQKNKFIFQIGVFQNKIALSFCFELGQLGVLPCFLNIMSLCININVQHHPTNFLHVFTTLIGKHYFACGSLLFNN